jgi:hypothetical protein
MLQKARLKSWVAILANSEYTVNDKKTYYKVYYPEFAGYSGIRAFYTSYFGKDVWVQPRLKYGKPFNDEFSVHTDKGVWLFNASMSWIETLYPIHSDMATRHWKPKARVAQPEPEPLESLPASGSTLSMSASGATPVSMGENLRALLKQAEEVKVEEVKVLPPKPDFSHLTFEQLFEV